MCGILNTLTLIPSCTIRNCRLEKILITLQAVFTITRGTLSRAPNFSVKRCFLIQTHTNQYLRISAPSEELTPSTITATNTSMTSRSVVPPTSTDSRRSSSCAADVAITPLTASTSPAAVRITPGRTGCLLLSGRLLPYRTLLPFVSNRLQGF